MFDVHFSLIARTESSGSVSGEELAHAIDLIKSCRGTETRQPRSFLPRAKTLVPAAGNY